MTPVRNEQPAVLRPGIIKVNAQRDQFLQNVVQGFAVREAMSMSEVPYTRKVRRERNWNNNVLVGRNCPVCIRTLVEEYRVDWAHPAAQSGFGDAVEVERGEEQP
jgi:hypothetical protein